MPTRADRRHRTDLTIAKRTKLMKTYGVLGGLGGEQQLIGHKLAKRHGLGSCSNRGCAVCAINRTEKREKIKAARLKARKLEKFEDQ